MSIVGLVDMLTKQKIKSYYVHNTSLIDILYEASYNEHLVVVKYLSNLISFNQYPKDILKIYKTSSLPIIKILFSDYLLENEIINHYYYLNLFIENKNNDKILFILNKIGRSLDINIINKLYTNAYKSDLLDVSKYLTCFMKNDDIINNTDLNYNKLEYILTNNVNINYPEMLKIISNISNIDPRFYDLFNKFI